MELPKGKRLILDIMKAKKIATTLDIDAELVRLGCELPAMVLRQHIINLEKHSPFEGYGYIKVIKGRTNILVLGESVEDLDKRIKQAQELKREIS